MATTSDSIIARNVDVLEAQLDGTRVLFHSVDGLYCDLDRIGSHVWQLLAEPCTLEDLISGLMRHYAIDRQTCRTDTLAFLTTLEEKGFVSVHQR